MKTITHGFFWGTINPLNKAVPNCPWTVLLPIVHGFPASSIVHDRLVTVGTSGALLCCYSLVWIARDAVCAWGGGGLLTKYHSRFTTRICNERRRAATKLNLMNYYYYYYFTSYFLLDQTKKTKQVACRFHVAVCVRKWFDMGKRSLCFCIDPWNNQGKRICFWFHFPLKYETTNECQNIEKVWDTETKFMVCHFEFYR